ncbi:peptide chain release factor N(5)-glutamine methyltransferase [Terrisporobacter mayombei]|uniref:Release factor glutamine methyltransferase n=1 Tax=Terrisporobacter mayombei TaxID=1541 RepID=A0ABY9Q473_9FIRM|nr:peptide chain release factor N(5)-glutamine methyltransferase [Terrisporobacter mayombei]MCC3869167.1 peptide chain release factor N(5)-glutamine methyltransferase [Terrisporobacter mayombei]WMT82697.1 Release factor glutamine methyltransferase [Terrisporobacter mayombei]
MTIKEIIIRYSKELEEISPTPRLDVETLLQKVLEVDRLYILLNLEKSLSEDEEKLFSKLINERLNNRPIAYIVGNREFMGLDFYVQEGVLIPRPDTEVLVEEIIELGKNKGPINILDIGTGSGAITVSLAKYLDNAKITSVDISDIALEIGKKNAESNNVKDRITFIKSDLFTNIDDNMRFDIIVSNPPYIKREVIETLDKQVKDFEPYNALEGGIDGLDFYRAITIQSKKYLNNDGILAYEVGHDQSEEVSKLMESDGYTNIYTRKDLQQIDRVVIGSVL